MMTLVVDGEDTSFRIQGKRRRKYRLKCKKCFLLWHITLIPMDDAVRYNNEKAWE
ncbi:unnamed protein product, partial [Musa banksii]